MRGVSLARAAGLAVSLVALPTASVGLGVGVVGAACASAVASPLPLILDGGAGGDTTPARPTFKRGSLVALSSANELSTLADVDTTGESFGSVVYPQSAVAGPVAFKADRAAVWTVGNTRRMILTGNVRITLATFEFEAKSAAVWTTPVMTAAGTQAEQCFVYFEGLGSAESSVGSLSFTGDALPVRAIVVPENGVQFAADVITREAPEADENHNRVSDPQNAAGTFQNNARRALVRSLYRAVGETDPADAPPPRPVFQAVMSAEGQRWAAALPESLQGTNEWQTRGNQRVAGLSEISGKGKTIAARGGAGAGSGSGSGSGGGSGSGSGSGAGSGSGSGTGAGGAVASSGGTPNASNAATGSGASANGTGATATAGGNAQAGSQAGSQTGPQTGAQGGSQVAGVPPQPIVDGPDAILPRDGTFTISPGNVTIVSEGTETQVMATGGVSVLYQQNVESGGKVLQLTAQRAVIFLDGMKLEQLASIDASKVRGVYLEGEVTATDGQYTVRGPQIYYDVRRNKAVMVDAVLWTYDEVRGLPLYVRAATIRQESSRQFSANNAELTNSAFFEPELSIGAASVTITRDERTVRGTGLDSDAVRTVPSTKVDARNVTARVYGTPIFWFPKYSGEVEDQLIRDVRFENRSGSGSALRITWNAYNLLGLQRDSEIKADLLTDYYFERGPAIGARVAWDTARNNGRVFGYAVPFDSGTDVFKPGTEAERDNEFRGIITFENRFRFDEKWTLLAEGAYISDEAFVDAFFEDTGETRREFTNRLAARRLEDNTNLTLEAKGSFNDFIANEWLLQSQGYSVTKLPEATYVRQADDVFKSYPGMVTSFTELRAGRYNLSFDEVLASERGLTTPTLSNRALGIAPGDRLSSALRGQGYFEAPIFRADVRQEFAGQFFAGPVTINPFVVGRATMYDDSFDLYSPGESDKSRLWGAVGARVSTTIQRVWNGAESRLFDVNRLRHIIEPNLTVMMAGTNIQSADLPIYDESVEALSDGLSIRLGLNQVLQTQRGAPGRSHTTDLLTLNTDFVFSNNEVDAKSPIGRFYDFRPELSNLGNYFLGDLALRVTDSTTITATDVYDFDAGRQDLAAVGLMFDHAPGYRSLVELRYLEPQDSTILTLGAMYDLTSKYSISVFPSYDIDASEFQSWTANLNRKTASGVLGLGLSYNEITGETSFGFVFSPYGAAGGGGFGNGGRVLTGP